MTGLVIGDDGAMYFTTGGRHTQGALYRVTYTGTEPTTPADLHDAEGDDARALRHELEAFHGHENLTSRWTSPGRSSPAHDRFLRYAARIAIESQPIEQWKARAFAENEPGGRADRAALGRAPRRHRARRAICSRRSRRFPLTKLEDEAQQLEKLRVIEVSLSRQGKTRGRKLRRRRSSRNSARSIPPATVSLNRELCQILLALECAEHDRAHAQAPRRRADAGRAAQLRRRPAHDHQGLDAGAAPPVFQLVDDQAQRQPASRADAASGLPRPGASTATARASTISS